MSVRTVTPMRIVASCLALPALLLGSACATYAQTPPNGEGTVLPGPAFVTASTPPASALFPAVLTTAQGSGCPGGTGVKLTQTVDGFKLEYPVAFTSRAGTGAPPGPARRNCQVAVTLTVPAGQTWVVAGGAYYQYVDLPAGATSELTSTTYQQAVSGRDRVYKSNDSGPVSGQSVPAENQAGLPAVCGQSPILNVNMAVVTASPTGSAASSRLTAAEFNLAWQPC